MKNLNYPFTAIVGQDTMKLALILNAINPSIGGVLVKGEKGTAKSTAVRALANVLPQLEIVADCPFSCPPNRLQEMCASCTERYQAGEELPVSYRKMRVINLPINASEDRVVGTLDLEKALKEGELQFAPGVLAEANRGILYVDEVNLLDDHIVDVLLDAAAMGQNIVEREGVSYNHPARFILVGTMNPEEGDLRPQLLDRFGLSLEIGGIRDVALRVEIVERRQQYELDPAAFVTQYQQQEQELAEQIVQAKERLHEVEVSRDMLRLIARINIELDTDGHRGDIVLRKTAQTYAAYMGKPAVTPNEIFKVADMALSHRLKHTALDKVTRSVTEVLNSIRQSIQK
jgi:Mg-chelatase subunit ChlI